MKPQFEIGDRVRLSTDILNKRDICYKVIERTADLGYWAYKLKGDPNPDVWHAEPDLIACKTWQEIVDQIITPLLNSGRLS